LIGVIMKALKFVKKKAYQLHMKQTIGHILTSI